jgi:hypothetical protein
MYKYYLNTAAMLLAFDLILTDKPGDDVQYLLQNSEGVASEHAIMIKNEV